MDRYFLAGNLWLAFAVTVLIGRTYARSEPYMVSVFGVGRWFYPNEYTLLVAALVAAAAFCFGLHFWFGRRVA